MKGASLILCLWTSLGSRARENEMVFIVTRRGDLLSRSRAAKRVFDEPARDQRPFVIGVNREESVIIIGATTLALGIYGRQARPVLATALAFYGASDLSEAMTRRQ